MGDPCKDLRSAHSWLAVDPVTELKIKILFVGVNPTDTQLLDLQVEARIIDSQLYRASLRNRFELIQCWEAQASELPGLLLRHQPQILHFSGHGMDGRLNFRGPDGTAMPADPSTIAAIFGVIKGVRCVVLNACHSSEQGEKLAEYVDTVIGMVGDVEDHDARQFSAGFYEALGYGRTIAEAYVLGGINTGLSSGAFGHRDLAYLYSREGVDPASIAWNEQAQTHAPALPIKQPAHPPDHSGVYHVERHQERSPSAPWDRVRAHIPMILGGVSLSLGLIFMGWSFRMNDSSGSDVRVCKGVLPSKMNPDEVEDMTLWEVPSGERLSVHRSDGVSFTYECSSSSSVHVQLSTVDGGVYQWDEVVDHEGNLILDLDPAELDDGDFGTTEAERSPDLPVPSSSPEHPSAELEGDVSATLGDEAGEAETPRAPAVAASRAHEPLPPPARGKAQRIQTLESEMIQDKFKDCGKSYAQGTTLKIVFAITVAGRTGTVESVSVTTNGYTTQREHLESCLEQTVLKLVFPMFEGELDDFTYHLNLERLGDPFGENEFNWAIEGTSYDETSAQPQESPPTNIQTPRRVSPELKDPFAGSR